MTALNISSAGPPTPGIVEMIARAPRCTWSPPVFPGGVSLDSSLIWLELVS